PPRGPPADALSVDVELVPVVRTDVHDKTLRAFREIEAPAEVVHAVVAQIRVWRVDPPGAPLLRQQLRIDLRHHGKQQHEVEEQQSGQRQMHHGKKGQARISFRLDARASKRTRAFGDSVLLDDKTSGQLPTAPASKILRHAYTRPAIPGATARRKPPLRRRRP